MIWGHKLDNGHEASVASLVDVLLSVSQNKRRRQSRSPAAMDHVPAVAQQGR